MSVTEWMVRFRFRDFESIIGARLDGRDICFRCILSPDRDGEATARDSHLIAEGAALVNARI